MDIKLIIFLAISFITVVSAAVVAFSKNIIHSAFALFGVFAGVLGLYILLSADFVAVIQLIVYIGGVLILILFAVMLTTKTDLKNGERKLFNKAMEPFAALIGVVVLGALLIRGIINTGFITRRITHYFPTTADIGDKLLNEYLLPFEIVSLLVVLVLVGAVVIARREVK